MNSSVCVATLQMTSTDNLNQNLHQADALLRKAHDAGAQLAVLPEYFAWMSAHDTDKLALAEMEGSGPIQDFLCRAAQDYQMWIIGGTLAIKTSDPQKVYNRCLVINPQGYIAAHYDKIHLFDFTNGTEKYCESRTITPGNIPQAVDTPWGRLGLSICYDLRFPELFRALIPIDILALPAAFTYITGSAHWNILLAARAIENQCYVIASAQTGLHPGGRLGQARPRRLADLEVRWCQRLHCAREEDRNLAGLLDGDHGGGRDQGRCDGRRGKPMGGYGHPHRNLDRSGRRSRCGADSPDRLSQADRRLHALEGIHPSD